MRPVPRSSCKSSTHPELPARYSALARIETSITSRKRSPSLATLRKYAAAVGCKLEIRLSPR
jgi:hypothetical protein